MQILSISRPVAKQDQIAKKDDIVFEKARIAQFKVVFRPVQSVGTYAKGAEHKIAEIYGGKWTGRDNGYLIDESRQEELKTALRLLREGKLVGVDIPYLLGGPEDRIQANEFRNTIKKISVS